MKVWLERTAVAIGCILLLPVFIVALPFILIYSLFFGLSREEMEYWCLLVLEDGPRTGYEILQEIEHRRGDNTIIGHGTIYAALDRLIKQGLVERLRLPSKDQKTIFKYRLTGKRYTLRVPEPRFKWWVGERVRQAFGAPAY